MKKLFFLSLGYFFMVFLCNAANNSAEICEKSMLSNNCDTISPSDKEKILRNLIVTSALVLTDSLKDNRNYRASLNNLETIASKMEYNNVNLFVANVVESAQYYNSLQNQGTAPLPSLPCTNQLKIAVAACTLLIVKDAVFAGPVSAVLDGVICLAAADLMFKECCKNGTQN